MTPSTKPKALSLQFCILWLEAVVGCEEFLNRCILYLLWKAGITSESHILLCESYLTIINLIETGIWNPCTLSLLENAFSPGWTKPAAIFFPEFRVLIGVSSQVELRTSKVTRKREFSSAKVTARNSVQQNFFSRKTGLSFFRSRYDTRGVLLPFFTSPNYVGSTGDKLFFFFHSNHNSLTVFKKCKKASRRKHLPVAVEGVQRGRGCGGRVEHPVKQRVILYQLIRLCRHCHHGRGGRTDTASRRQHCATGSRRRLRRRECGRLHLVAVSNAP